MNKWSETTLHNKIDIKHGFPFKSDFFASEGDYIVLTPGNFLENGGFKREEGKEKYYISSIPEEYLLKKGDLIVAMTEQAEGLLGSCAFVPENNLYLHNQRLGLITVKDDSTIDLEYIYHLFKTKWIRKQIRLTSTGSKVKHTSPERICDVQVKIPTVDIQKNIASVLNNIDKKIELNNKINSELESMATLIYDYWFVQFDFPDSNGKPYKSSGGKMIWNEELKREIPEGWSNKKLKDILKVGNDQLTPSDTPEKLFKYLSIPVFDKTESYELEKGDAIGSNKFVVDKNDLCVSKLNPWFNRVYYPIADDNLICTTEMVVWKTNDEFVKNFFYELATSQHFIGYCTQSATGTSNSHKRVNPTVMLQYKLPYHKEKN
jgi:restriction endonuclease S subunit